MFASILGLHHNVTFVDKDIIKPETSEISRILLPKEHPLDPIERIPKVAPPVSSFEQPKINLLSENGNSKSFHNLNSVSLESHSKISNSTNGRQDMFHMALAAAPPRGEVSASRLHLSFFLASPFRFFDYNNMIRSTSKELLSHDWTHLVATGKVPKELMERFCQVLFLSPFKVV